METPDEWPSEIQESYDPIRILGTGGFASVVLACHKTAAATATAMPNNTTGTGTGIHKNKVAIKVVGSNQEDSNSLHSAVLYAQREIEILKHVHHPNIIRLFHHWIQDENQSCSEKKKNRTQKQSRTAAVLVLEYVRGPTVESLLKHGGALSTNFGRIVIAQTIDAIAYIHCHAVLHRDIKPDNIIVTSTGALSSDAFVWDNENDTEDESSIIGGVGGQHPGHGHGPAPNWEALRSKYKVTLIDFGFARALTPNDVSKPSIETKRNDSELASYHRISNDRAYKDSKGKGTGTGNDKNDDLGASEHSTRSTRSLSHNMKRAMSTLGNINFAAPEIVNKVRPQFRPRSELPIESPQQALRRHTSTTETISNYVADYGLLVDSYSMGHTIRYMMTGVRPGMSIEDIISQQQRGVWVKKLFSLCLGKSNSTDKNKKQKRSVRVRRIEDLPGDFHLLIEALTQLSEENRISIRKARWTVPWITDVLESQAQEQEQCPPMASPLASQSQSLTQTPQINNEKVNEEQKEETSPSQALEEEAFRSNFYRIKYLPFASIPPSEKPVAPESDSNATVATALWGNGCNIDDAISPEDPTETSLMF